MKVIRLLYIITVSPNNYGISSFVLNFYNNLDHDKYKIDFILIEEPNDSVKASIGRFGGRYFVLTERTKRPFGYVKRLKKIMIENKYDIVHAHGNSHTLFFELFAAYKAKIPIRLAHAHSVSCKSKMLHKLLSLPFKAVCMGGFACSLEAGRFLFGRKKFSVIKNAIDVKRYGFNEDDRRDVRKSYGISEKAIVIGHTGMFTESKNQIFILEILKKLLSGNKEYVAMLIGDGDRLDVCKEYVEKNGLKKNVVFTGAQDDVCLFLSAFDIFVFPSLYEGFGISVLEAQANGLPVLASDTLVKQTKVLDSYSFVSLEKGPDYWAEQIEKTKLSRELSGEKKVSDKGYDISLEAKKLMEEYDKYLLVK